MRCDNTYKSTIMQPQIKRLLPQQSPLDLKMYLEIGYILAIENDNGGFKLDFKRTTFQYVHHVTS